MQGPIGRYDRLSPQFNEPHYFSLENTEYGLQLMLWGFFKKIVIADRIGVVADKVFLHPYDYNGIFVIVGVLAYCLQLYADFRVEWMLYQVQLSYMESSLTRISDSHFFKVNFRILEKVAYNTWNVDERLCVLSV